MEGEPYSRVGVDGTAVDVEIIFSQHLGPLVNGSSRSIEYSPQHVLGHTDFETVASELDFRLALVSVGRRQE